MRRRAAWRRGGAEWAARTFSALLIFAAASTTALASEVVFDLKVERGVLPEAMRLMRVHEGDSVRLRWTSDRALVFHLHGYDIERRVGAGAVSEMSFTANATGRFPIEVHKSGAGGAEDVPLAVIEVYPH